MRHFAFAVLSVAVIFLVAARADAQVLVRIDRARQTMDVSVDGYSRYTWPVSTGRRGLATPAGMFHPQSMAVRWYSRKYYHSPMPHSIFFYGGLAIHGSYDIAQIGRAVSHGCVRLYPANATVLFDLVRREGMHNTTIVVQ